jgi:MYXO-CTERM domain-containing protein
MKTPIVCLCVVLGFAGFAQAAMNSMFDDFESYADQAAFQAAWPSWASNGSSMSLLQGFGAGGSNQSVDGVAPGNNQTWNYKQLNSLTDYDGTDENPVVFEFDMYDDNPAAGGVRNFISLRAYQAADGSNPGMPTVYSQQGVAPYNIKAILAAGLYNGAPCTTDKYAARVGLTWLNTGVVRTQGWHHFKLVSKTASADVYVDGVLTNANVAYASGAAYSGMLLGSGLTSAGYDAVFDNVSVSVSPEPVTLALLGMGALVLRRRRAA